MSKTIYIGDIHGMDVWKDIVSENCDADNVVFIGDYFDSYDINPAIQLRNLEDIIDYKEIQELDPSKNVYLLIGNHDFHYWPGVIGRGGTSGFQATMMHQFEHVFREHKDKFQMSVTIDNRLCTHAGVSEDFLKDLGYWTYDKHTDYSYVSEFLNDLFKYKPNEFSFTSYQDRHGGYTDGYGNNEGQSPIWIRPAALQRSNKKTNLKKNYIQIIGHTFQNCIDIKGKTTGGKYYYIDTLPSGEYLIDEDGEFEVGRFHIL